MPIWLWAEIDMGRNRYGPKCPVTFETADAGDTLWDSGCRRHTMRQQMQETLYGTADAGDTL